MKITLLFTLFFIASAGFSQTADQEPFRIRCSALEHEKYLESIEPDRKAERERYEEAIREWISANKDFQPRAPITIPVVIHVLYKNAKENISDNQLLAGIKVLNEDYSRSNADASKTPAAFQQLAASAGIEFCMARVDPKGKPTTGIVRKQTSIQSFSTDDKVKFNASGGDDAWDVKKYLNIWICDLGPQTLGYGEFPKSTLTNTFGLVCHYNTWGLGGVTLPPYNLGRTSTHEVGHCFNLNHIWGDEPGCAKDDNVSDTPMQRNEHVGMPSYPATAQRCNSSDPSAMFMNYMDYTDDKGMNMFTKGQVTRMLAVLNNPPWNVLLSSKACAGPTAVENVLPLARHLNIYPNPAEKTATLEFNLNQEGHVSISLANAMGQVVLSEDIGFHNPGGLKHELNVGALQNGLYFVTVRWRGTSITRKLSISK